MFLSKSVSRSNSIYFCLTASSHFVPPCFTGDLLCFSRNNTVFKSDLLFPPPDSARFELLMSRFSLPLGISWNSWPQSGLISMHNVLHPAFCFVEFAPKLVSLEELSALEGFLNSALGVSRLQMTWFRLLLANLDDELFMLSLGMNWKAASGDE